MRLLFFCIIFLWVAAIPLAAQQAADSLLFEGIALYDKGEYRAAIKMYEKALLLEPESMHLYYEIAFTYMAMKKFPEVITNCEKALASKDSLQNKALIYSLMGSAYDNQGMQAKALEVYDEGLKVCGDDYLLHFNKGVTYRKMKDTNEAIRSFIMALSLNPLHMSANLALAELLDENGNIGLAAYNYGFFLLFESNTERSKQALGRIMQMGIAEKVHAPLPGFNGRPTSTEQLNRIVAAAQAPSSYLKLYRIFGDFYGEREKLDETGLPEMYKSFYIPFFTALVGEGYLEVYCRKASVAMDRTSATWISKHEKEVQLFQSWVTAYWNKYSGEED